MAVAVPAGGCWWSSPCCSIYGCMWTVARAVEVVQGCVEWLEFTWERTPARGEHWAARSGGSFWLQFWRRGARIAADRRAAVGLFCTPGLSMERQHSRGRSGTGGGTHEGRSGTSKRGDDRIESGPPYGPVGEGFWVGEARAS
jgi:hypothetical protein